jgi:hypothetical protein
VVVDGVTGFLVPVEQMPESPFEPLDPENSSAIWRRGSTN